MNLFKKTISMILALTLLWSMVPWMEITVAAEETEETEAIVQETVVPEETEEATAPAMETIAIVEEDAVISPEDFTCEEAADVLQDVRIDDVPVLVEMDPVVDSVMAAAYGEDTQFHNTLDALATEDYLAFSAIAYENFTNYSGKTVKQALTAMKLWDKLWSEEQDITYAQLCKYIAGWKVLEEFNDSANQFYAISFISTSGDAVLAYRGSKPLTSALELITDWDTFYDWLLNDFPMIVFNHESFGSQYENAISAYNTTCGDVSRVAVTGHSLGGLWADVASAYSGCKGITFNAISALDIIHYNHPVDMGRYFTGINTWNFWDHVNECDILAGMTEYYMPEYIGAMVKPYVSYSSNFKPLKFGLNHGLDSIVQKDANNNVRLNNEESSWTSKVGVSNHMSFTRRSVDLGTDDRDEFVKGLSMTVFRASFGGDGNDKIISSIQDDKIIGGQGNDTLDGGIGNDVYHYFKGDGCDTINDLAGADTLYLHDFSDSDIIELFEESEESKYIEILCNGKTIVKINKEDRTYTWLPTSAFTVYVDRGGANNDKYNITEYFNTRRYGARLLIGCPVDVKILDTEGNVVYTIKDGEVGEMYTDYGNFYVYEEEDGGYGKVLDLIEGYTAQIVGVDEGTMSVSYQDFTEEGLGEAVTTSDIPVAVDFIATVEEVAAGEAILKMDTDGDGTVDQNLQIGQVRSVPMFRMYDPNSGEHFYTGSIEEREILVKAGWNYEGVGFNFPVAGDPVYRLYEPLSGEHLYTMDMDERARLLADGWNAEPVAFNSAGTDAVPQYRVHNPNATRGAYHFTSSTEERDHLISLGWIDEGIGWYSCLR